MNKMLCNKLILVELVRVRYSKHTILQRYNHEFLLQTYVKERIITSV